MFATAFLIASKVIGGAIRVETWIVLGLALTLLGVLHDKPRLARRAGTLTLVFVTAIGILPVGDLIIGPLERSVPAQLLPDSVDGIIILGGAEDGSLSRYWNQPVFNDAGERFTAAVTLSRKFPTATVLFSGGSGALATIGQTVTDPAMAASQVMTDLGVPSDRIRLETGSRNTAENARFSHDLIGPEPGQRWILVTSAFHMPRALRSFGAAGWTGIIPYPVDYRTGASRQNIGWDLAGHMLVLNIALKEHVGRLAYVLTGQ